MWNNLRPKSALYHGRIGNIGRVSKLHMVEIYTGFYEIGKFVNGELANIIQSGLYHKWIKYLSSSDTNMLLCQ